MATLFTCTFPSIDNVEFIVNIDDRDYGGSPTKVDCAADGFTLSYDGKEEILNAIIGSRLEFTMAVSSSTETAIDSFATALLSSDEERYTVEITRDSGSGHSLFWVGYVIPDLSGYEDKEPPYGFKISANDGISRLKNIDYNDGANPPEPTSDETFLTHILNCLTQGVLHTNYYGASEHYLKTCVNWVDSRIGTPTTTECPLTQTRVNGRIFAERNNSNDTTEWDFMSCYEVLEHILKGWQARLYYSNGSYRVEQVAERAADTYYERRFSYDGTLQSSANNAASDITIQQTTVNEKLAGNQFDYLPAYAKVTAIFRHDTATNYLAATGGKWTGATVQTSTVTIPNVTTDTDTRFYIRARVALDVSLGASYTVPWRYVVLMRVVKNSQYLQSETFSVTDGQGNYMQQVGRDPITWNGSTAYYEISTPFSTSTSINHVEFIDIEVGSIPSSGDTITVQFSLDSAYNLSEVPLVSPTVNSWAISQQQFYIVDATDEDTFVEKVREFEVENPTSGNSETLEHEMIFGSTVYGWTLANLYTYNGSAWAASGDDWDRDTNTDDLAFGQLWVQQAMALYKYPTKVYSGQFQTKSLMAHSRAVFDFDSTAWLMMRGTFSAREHVFQGAWMAAGIDETSITPGPPIKKGGLPGKVPFDPEIRIIPGGFSPTATGLGTKLSELALTALTANFVGSTISAGTITSIPVRETIPQDAFIDGDNIFILNPSTGEVIPLTVSTNSTAGDSAIAVDSTSIANDIPAGGIILYSVMNKYAQTGGAPVTGLPTGANKQTIYYSGTTATASSALTNDGTYIGVNTDPSTSYMLRVKGASGPKGLFVERNSSAAGLHLYHDGAATVESVGGLNLDIQTAANSLINIYAGGGGSQIRQVLLYPLSSITTALGNGAFLDMTGTYAPTTAGGDWSMFRLGTNINQTGSADQITRGLYINPALTAVASAGFRAVEYPRTVGHFLYQGGGTGVDSYILGSIGVGTGTTTPSAKIDIVGDGATSSTYGLKITNSSSGAVICARDDQRVGILTTSPSTTLDVGSATDGITIPAGTTAQRPAVNNTLRYGSSVSGLEFRHSGFWHRLTSYTSPSAAAGAGAGTGPTVSITHGYDLSHKVNITTGTGASSGTLATVTFSAALDSGLFTHVVIGAANANAAGIMNTIYIGSTGNTSYTIVASSAPADSTQYQFFVLVKQG